MKSILRTLTVLLLAILLTACGSSINEHNYKKIKPNMSLEEVTQILGEPSEKTGMKFGNMSATTATWEAKNKKIVIQFLNGKVKFKNFTGDGVQRLDLEP